MMDLGRIDRPLRVNLVTRIESIRKLLESSPDDTFLLYSLGMELLGAEQPAEAIEQFQRVIRQDPGYLAAYLQAGQAMLSTGDSSGAAAMLRRGIALAAEQGDQHAADRLKLLLTAVQGTD